MQFSFMEFFDLVFMIVMLGLIFMYFFKGFGRVKKQDDVIAQYQRGFDLEAFKFSLAVIAPAIVLHELAHKFVALAFGLEATFHASYIFLFIGLVLSMLNFKFLFFIPGYVAISLGTPLQGALTAFAGPFINLLLWIAALLTIKYKWVDKKYLPAAYLTKQINMFLFFFNMLPIWMFDGAKFFSGMYQYLLTIF